MQICVVGNCQSALVADALAAFHPGAEIVRHNIGDAKVIAGAAEIAASLPAYDRVFSHPIFDERLGPLRRDAMLAARPDVVFVPGILFGGFQPDCIYVRDEAGPLPSPLNVYHSAIAAAGFAAGLDVARTVRLFGALTYARLGYFEEYEAERIKLIRHHARLGLDISDRIGAWQRGGAFMFTVNHPRAAPVTDTVRLVLRQRGEAAPDYDDLSDIVGERLWNHPVFPVYPEIGRRIGVPGHTLFRSVVGPDGVSAPMDLRMFVERSFVIYEAHRERLLAAVPGTPKLAAALALLRG
ncbi:WcbI family polysaccharide biosynthesis putative acetyltransferase [Roseomonas sp. CCTCC AB2023176]|uniref:WcbI family polysaccharide biosynthesis putative acetyltransferase n=1 Tax=Roseomonas sp. CCTCC AB2023176 TaxID=3342640 RepID=UPI0035DCF086